MGVDGHLPVILPDHGEMLACEAALPILAAA
jgi:hypothetical protein